MWCYIVMGVRNNFLQFDENHHSRISVRNQAFPFVRQSNKSHVDGGIFEFINREIKHFETQKEVGYV